MHTARAGNNRVPRAADLKFVVQLNWVVIFRAMLIAVLLASLAFSVPFSYTIAANVGSYPDDSHRERSAIYVNSWAVKIRGKSSEADVVAQRNGFQNLGLVSLNHQPLHNNLASAGCRIF